MLMVLTMSTSGSPHDFSRTNTKDLGFRAKTLVPFSRKVTFSRGLYSLLEREDADSVWSRCPLFLNFSMQNK